MIPEPQPLRSSRSYRILAGNLVLLWPLLEIIAWNRGGLPLAEAGRLKVFCGHGATLGGYNPRRYVERSLLPRLGFRVARDVRERLLGKQGSPQNFAGFTRVG